MRVLTEAQVEARARFDLDAVMAGLPENVVEPKSALGALGVKLDAKHTVDMTDAELDEFARSSLGAQRIRPEYREALRIVLGNQAAAERGRYVLEQNQRVGFASERVMRTINEQMNKANITVGRKAYLGGKKVSTIQCFEPPEQQWQTYDEILRKDEEQSLVKWGANRVYGVVPQGILESDIPY